MAKQLIQDTAVLRFSIMEASEGGKLKARGEFARADTPTANKRVYPRKIWEQQLKKLQESIEQRKMLGELDHPQDGKTKLTRASHIITSLEIAEDGQVIGEFEVLDTPNGKTLKALIDANCAVGVSSRGYGSVKMNEEGLDVVQEDFTLMTFDAVSDPACATSYPDFTTEQKEVKNSLSESAIADAKKMLLDYKIPFEDIIQRGKEIIVTFIKEPLAKKFAKLFSLYGGESVSIEHDSDKWNVRGVATMEESFVQVCEAWSEESEDLKKNDKQTESVDSDMDDEENFEGYEDDSFLMHHVVYDFYGKKRKDTSRGAIGELDVDFPLSRLYDLKKSGLVSIEKGLVYATPEGEKIADEWLNKNTKGSQTEQTQDIASRQAHVAAIKKEVEQAQKQSPQDAKELENSMKEISRKWKINPDLIKTEAASLDKFTVVRNQKSQFGRWIQLENNKYTVHAKIFEEPSKEFGVDGSNISKLTIINKKTKEEVYNYDRGLDFDKAPSGLVASIIAFLKPEAEGYKQIFAEAGSDDTEVTVTTEDEKPTREAWLKQEPKKTPSGTVLYPFWHPELNKGTWVTIPDDDIEESHKTSVTSLEWAVEQVTPILKEKILAEFTEAFREKTRSVMDENRKLKEENFNLASISKELGFSLYLERNCSNHPRFQQLKESLKGFKHVETIEELKTLCAPYIEESKEITRQQSIQHKMEIQKLESRVSDLQERAQSLIEQNRNVVNQLQESKILVEGYENRFYLEKRLLGHPSAIEIKKLFEDRNPTSKDEVDKVVSAFRRKIETGPSLIESVQNALKRRRMPVNTIVEDCVLPTMPKQKPAYIPEADLTVSDFEKLAGVHSK